MGIFDFVKDAGSKIGLGESKKEVARAAADAAKDEELSELREANKLLNLIIGMNQVQQPRVEFDDGVATLWGTAPTQQIKETTVLVVGNVQGVARVDDRMEVVEPAPEATFYTVVSGDSLSKIAKSQYGDATKYMVIFKANQPMLEDPNMIYPGQVLRIPADY